MADFLDHSLKQDDWWSEEGRFQEVHLHVLSQMVTLGWV